MNKNLTLVAIAAAIFIVGGLFIFLSKNQGLETTITQITGTPETLVDDTGTLQKEADGVDDDIEASDTEMLQIQTELGQ